MQNELPNDVQERLKNHMRDGGYSSEGDVIRDAMDALEQLDEDRRIRWSERNRLAIEQSERGLSKPLDDEAVIQRLRERLASEGIVD